MNVKTTKITKKYKDKNTNEWKELTIDHAKVKDRLKAFWEANPMGKIETSSIKDGQIITFKTHIVADKSNPFSREASGHSMGNIFDDKGNISEKAFEKLETISVGRALALLGYATDGEIASLEEMEDFIEYKKTQQEEKIFELKLKVDDITSVEELRKFYSENRGNGVDFDQYVIERGKKLKAVS